MSKIEESMEYFRKKASGYDLVETQLYWNLSDELLWNLLRTTALDKFHGRSMKFMDAGGGTGRWSIKILDYLSESTCVLCDISDEMRLEALKKIKERELDQRALTKKCNIENMPSEDNNSYDLVMNLHNVLGFTDNAEKALFEMYRVLKPGGFLISVVPNKYHAVFFNILLRRFDAARHIAENSKGTFTDNMPEITMFTPDGIIKYYEKIGMKDIKVFGFPVTIYPQAEEAKISGTSLTLEEILSNKKIFDLIASIEKNMISEEAAARGNNLFIIGRK